MTKKKPENTIQVAFRLEPSLIKRLDAHAERLGDAVPGLKITRVDALRALLLPALDAAERGARR